MTALVSRFIYLHLLKSFWSLEDSNNRKINIPVSIMLLMEDILKLAQDLNIYICRHIYKEANRTVDCLANKSISILESSVWRSNFPIDVINVSFEY